MIGKTFTSKDFGRSVRYVLDRKEATILDAMGVTTKSVASITRDFNIQRLMRPGLGIAVGHLILSWSTEEMIKLSPRIMAERARQFMEKMDILNTQYLTVQHTDRQHPHIHIIYNRVNNNGKTISDKFEHTRCLKICKELTLKYGERIVTSKKNVNRDALNGKDRVRYELFDKIRAAAKETSSWKQLQRNLHNQGINLVFKYRSGTSEIQGISFGMNMIAMKGSAIDPSLSYFNLNRQLEANSIRIAREHARMLLNKINSQRSSGPHNEHFPGESAATINPGLPDPRYSPDYPGAGEGLTRKNATENLNYDDDERNSRKIKR